MHKASFDKTLHNGKQPCCVSIAGAELITPDVLSQITVGFRLHVQSALYHFCLQGICSARDTQAADCPETQPSGTLLHMVLGCAPSGRINQNRRVLERGAGVWGTGPLLFIPLLFHQLALVSHHHPQCPWASQSTPIQCVPCSP